MIDIEQLKTEFAKALAAATTSQELFQLQKTYTGKKGPIKKALGNLKSVPAEDRRTIAQQLNALKQELESQLASASEAMAAKELEAKLAAEWMDMSMPGVFPEQGGRHPVTEVERRCLEVLRQLGFEWVDGPEIEDAFHNFDALNIPKHHPARDMQDTFWVTGGKLLRSHTTTVQARVLETQKELPIRVASMGRVYRNEAVDATHLAMFHQLEGIWIDEGLTFADLKGILAFIAKALYGDHPIRFKPKFYPYTEPSVGVDMQCSACRGQGCYACHTAGWVTILGAGMVHPKVFETFGFDPNVVSGIAFGLGTTRMAAQRVNAPAVKPLYDQDLPLLSAMIRGNK